MTRADLQFACVKDMIHITMSKHATIVTIVIFMSARVLSDQVLQK